MRADQMGSAFDATRMRQCVCAGGVPGGGAPEGGGARLRGRLLRRSVRRLRHDAFGGVAHLRGARARRRLHHRIPLHSQVRRSIAIRIASPFPLFVSVDSLLRLAPTRESNSIFLPSCVFCFNFNFKLNLLYAHSKMSPKSLTLTSDRSSANTLKSTLYSICPSIAE